MLSRVADAIYWMARYVERAENIARFVEVTLHLSLDLPTGIQDQWEPLVSTTGDREYFAEHYGAFKRENVIRFLTLDARYSNSILSSLAFARENARSVRDTISSEAWEQLNESYHLVRDAARSTHNLERIMDFCRTVRQHSHLFHGILDATMLRGEGWHFANLGRLLERADKTSRILDVKYFTLLPKLHDVGTPIDDLQWSAVLRSVSGHEMFRKRYHTITVHRVVEFLILDIAFPRAVHFCVAHADDSLRQLTGAADRSYRNLAEQRLGRLRAEFTYGDVKAIVDSGLHEFIDRLQSNLNSVDVAFYEVFFHCGAT
jgi:uncharacterized alpha-E superfamily protein